MSSILGIVSFISYPGFSDKAVKFSASVLIIYTAIAPFMDFVNDVYDLDFDAYFEEIKNESSQGNSEYLKVSEEAFKEGICKLLVTKYGIKRENVAVFVFGFDFEKMKAEKINVILSGKACTADFRGMEEYLNGLSLGKCEVQIDI